MRSSFRALVVLGLSAGFLAACGDLEPGEAESSDPSRDPSIVGGANSEWVPYFVMGLQKTSTGHSPNNCGGTLISKCHVLTAGHCIGRYGVNDQAYIGAWRPYVRNNANKPSQRIDISQEFAHPSYRSAGRGYDVGIFRLKSCVTNASIKPIALAPENFNASGMATAYGFGRLTQNSSAKPQWLQKVSVPLIPRNKCNTSYYPGKITAGMLCAGYDSGGKDACQGDSGGPLVAVRNGKKVLVGVTSWGSGCAKPKKPGVYANVSHFSSWIKNEVCKDGRERGSALCGGTQCSDRWSTSTCVNYKNRGFCSKYSWMKTYCCATCGGQPPPPPSCSNKWSTSTCVNYKNRGWCSKYSWMKTYCCATCKG